MKKTLLYISILAIGIVVLGGAGYVYARSQTPAPFFASDFTPAQEATANGLNFARGGDAPFEHRGKPSGPRGFPGWDDSLMAPYIKEAAADVLGLSVDELETRLENGERPRDIIEAQDLTLDEFKTSMEAAHDDILDQAVANDVITQVWADWLKDAQAAREIGEERPENPLKPYYLDATASVLGISVEELEAYKESGEQPSNVLEKLGLTPEELHTEMQEAREAALAEAVADGVITQAQADQMAEQGFGMDGRFHKGGCRGGHPGGGFVPRGENDSQGFRGFPKDQQPPAESPASLQG